MYATCAGLFNYPDRPAPAGSRPEPEVAAALPVRSADGKTYTFTIRRGFRFSPPSNAPVTAQTFKFAIERALSPKIRMGPARNFAGDIVGVDAYEAGKAKHISGVRARGNTLTVQLTHPSPDILSRLALPHFCAVPPGTPIEARGVNHVPSAGPYYVASYTHGTGRRAEAESQLPRLAAARVRRDRLQRRYRRGTDREGDRGRHRRLRRGGRPSTPDSMRASPPATAPAARPPEPADRGTPSTHCSAS